MANIFQDISTSLKNTGNKIIETAQNIYKSVTGFVQQPKETISKPLTEYQAWREIEKKRKGLPETSYVQFFIEELSKNIISEATNIAREVIKAPIKIAKDFYYNPAFGREPKEIDVPVLGHITSFYNDYTNLVDSYKNQGVDDSSARLGSFLIVGGQTTIDAVITGDLLKGVSNQISKLYTKDLINKLDAWTVLGKPKTPEVLKTNYKQLAQQLHPDKIGGSTEAMSRINNAYELLEKTGLPTTQDLIKLRAGEIAIRSTKPISEIKKAITPPTKAIGLKELPGTVTVEDQPAFGLSIKKVEKIGEVAKETPKISPVDRVVSAIKEAKPLRKTQEKLYTTERGKRFTIAQAMGKTDGGETGFYAELGQLKGALPKVNLEPLRDISQTDIDEMFNMVVANPWLKYTETISARNALVKLFSKEGTTIPTKSELELLDTVFGEKFTKAIMEKGSMVDKVKEAIGQLANIPRSLMSSTDLSFGGRQGLFPAVKFRKEFFASWKEQFKMLGSEKMYKETMENITKNPYFDLAKESGISFTDVGGVMSAREEKFMSNWAEKIPIVGKIVRASGRAYTGFANKFRMDMFASMVKDAKNIGLEPSKDLTLARNMARFVNAATGRGDIGRTIEGIGPILNAGFFSPRLLSSRLTLLNPLYYVQLDPYTRKTALKSLFSFLGLIASMLGLSKLAGAEVETNPTSSDFAKIKIGKTRIDVAAGFQQYIRTIVQFIKGETKSTTTGKITKVGIGYKPLTRFDILLNFLENKEAPIFSFATTLMKGQDFLGEPINIPKEIANRFIPMVIQDINDIKNTDPNLLPLGILGFFGMGLQTYTDEETIASMAYELSKKIQAKDPTAKDYLANVVMKNIDEKEVKAFSQMVLDNINGITGLVGNISADEPIEDRAKKITDQLNKLNKEKRVEFLKELVRQRILTEQTAEEMVRIMTEQNKERE